MVFQIAGHGRHRDLGPVGASERQRLGLVRVEPVQPAGLQVDGVHQEDARHRVDVAFLQDLRDAALGRIARPLVDDEAGHLGVVLVVEKPDAGPEPGAERVEVRLLQAHALLREDRAGDTELVHRLHGGVVGSGRRIGRVPLRIVEHVHLLKRLE